MNPILTIVTTNNKQQQFSDVAQDFSQLLKVIKADASDIIKEYNIREKVFKKVSNLDELKTLLAPFGDKWDTWTNGLHSYFRGKK